MVDISKAVRMAVDTGKVKFGTRDGIKAALKGDAKLILLSSNCPEETRSDITRHAKLSGVQVHVFAGTSFELGSLCGKPFPVSALCIFEPGNSNILEIIKQ